MSCTGIDHATFFFGLILSGWQETGWGFGKATIKMAASKVKTENFILVTFPQLCDAGAMLDSAIAIQRNDPVTPANIAFILNSHFGFFQIQWGPPCRKRGAVLPLRLCQILHLQSGNHFITNHDDYLPKFMSTYLNHVATTRQLPNAQQEIFDRSKPLKNVGS